MEANLGSVSRGTNVYDHFHAFAKVLAKLHPAAHDQVFSPATGFTVFPSEALEDPSHSWWKTRDARDAASMLEEALNECAPEGLFFGPNLADETNFGFWSTT